MKQLKITLTLAGILLIGFTFGQAPKGFTELADNESFKKKVKETSVQTQSISSDFIQEKHLTMMEEVLVSKGRFLFKKENKVKWEYIEPIVYAIIINQNRFIINNDGKISEFDTESNKLFKEINNMIVMAIRGDFVDNPDFSATFYQDEKRYLAILVPQNELLVDILTQIEIYFLKENTAVDEVIFAEPGDDFTKIVFKNRKVNIEISDEQFDTK
jgi:outer membrane lipoprotein carrier protein